jgi:hypothetical protein
MRIRQVKPEFWSDSDMAALPYAVRLVYIGLWCVADDAGYIDWRPDRIAHDLLGYESAKVRVRHLTDWSKQLVDTGHLQILGCGCALIPTLAKHQRVTGKQNFRYREAHGKHLSLTGKQSIAPERNGSGTVGNVDGTVGPVASDPGEPSEFTRRFAAIGGRLP